MADRPDPGLAVELRRPRSLLVRHLARMALRPRQAFFIWRQLRALPGNFVAGLGDGGFLSTGWALVDRLRRQAGLSSTDRVLDIGCGLGRLAIPLQAVLGRRGRYDGVDVIREQVAWASAAISRRSPRFRFHHLDVFNGAYNASGRTPPEDARLPFGSATFDVAVATSLFTHLSDVAIPAYFGEIARVLRPGGRLFATFFLLDDAVRARAARGQTTPALRHRWGRALTADPRRPEMAVGHDLVWISRELRTAGLAPRRPHYPGSWSGGVLPQGGWALASYQDSLIADRRPADSCP